MSMKTLSRKQATEYAMKGMITSVKLSKFDPRVNDGSKQKLSGEIRFSNGSFYTMSSPTAKIGKSRHGSPTISARSSDGGRNLDVLDAAVVREAKSQLFGWSSKKRSSK